LKAEAYIFGIFPRDERLIEATRRYPQRIKEMVTERTKKLLRLQEGLSYVSDPLLGWDDMLRPIVQNFEGMEVDGLNRFFETNTFYRIPVTVGKIRSNGRMFSRIMAMDLLKETGRPFLLELPDPFTFASLCLDKYYGDKGGLIEDYAKAMNGELKDVKDDNFRLLVLKAPSIAFASREEDLELIKKGLRVLTDGLNVPAILHIYFRKVDTALSHLGQLPVSGIGIDLFASGSKVPDDYRYECLALSAIDARNTRMETVSGSLRKVKEIVTRLNLKKLYLTNNSDLELLPYVFAIRKVRALRTMLKATEEAM
jgi:5-methyltetrahydropteroyltriglutamate--homocysteine methyltransferase